MIPGRNGLGLGLKPSPKGKADRREANPERLVQACFGECTVGMIPGRNGRGLGLKPSPKGKVDHRVGDPSLSAISTVP
jgi:hypothetical protein